MSSVRIVSAVSITFVGLDRNGRENYEVKLIFDEEQDRDLVITNPPSTDIETFRGLVGTRLTFEHNNVFVGTNLWAYVVGFRKIRLRRR